MSDPTPRPTPPMSARPQEPRLPDDTTEPARRPHRRRTRRALALAAVFALIIPAAVYGFNSIGNTWSTVYPASASRTNAGCQLCHRDPAGGDPFNA